MAQVLEVGVVDPEAAQRVPHVVEVGVVGRAEVAMRGRRRAVRPVGGRRARGGAMGLAIGWWPSFGISSGAYIKLNGDGSGTIITGAQECGSGAVMALPTFAAVVPP